MKSFMVIREPEAYRLLADETRRKMLYLLRVKEMTVNEIAEELGITSQAIYHHIRKLLNGRMVEVSKEKRTGHLIESYYRATAEDFLLSTGKVSSATLHDRKLAEQEMAAILRALKKIGFALDFTKEHIGKLVDIQGESEQCHEVQKLELEDKIWNMEELDLLTRRMTMDFANILLMSNTEFADQLENRKRLRELLLSLKTN